MSDDDRRRKLEDLDAKLTALKAGQQTAKAHQEEHYSQAQIAWRMVTEMVAGLGIGFGIGYGLDVLLGTSPFLMVVFALLGIAAGINVMLRTAKEVQRKQAAAASQHDASPKSGRQDEGTRDGD